MRSFKYASLLVIIFHSCKNDISTSESITKECQIENKLLVQTLQSSDAKSFYYDEKDLNYTLVFNHPPATNFNDIKFDSTIFKIEVDSLRTIDNIGEKDFAKSRIYISPIYHNDSIANVNIYSLHYGRNYNFSYVIDGCELTLRKISTSDI